MAGTAVTVGRRRSSQLDAVGRQAGPGKRLRAGPDMKSPIGQHGSQIGKIGAIGLAPGQGRNVITHQVRGIGQRKFRQADRRRDR